VLIVAAGPATEAELCLLGGHVQAAEVSQGGPNLADRPHAGDLILVILADHIPDRRPEMEEQIIILDPRDPSDERSSGEVLDVDLNLTVRRPAEDVDPEGFADPLVVERLQLLGLLVNGRLAGHGLGWDRFDPWRGGFEDREQS
jgi:hypothetical protein